MKRTNSLLTVFGIAGLSLALTFGAASFADEPAKKKDDHGHKHDEPKKDAKKDEKKEEKKEEKKTEGAVVGKKAPEFTLTDTDGKTVKLADLLADKDTKAVVIEWFNPQCPFIVKHHEKNPTFSTLYKDFSAKGVKFVAINSSAKGMEGNGLDKNIKAKKDWKIEYPILIDEDGKVAAAYGSTATPHMFIVTKDGNLAYSGAIDDNRSATEAGKKNYVRNAVEEILKGSNVTEAQNKAYGCSIKQPKK